MKIERVYLAGGINGLTDSDANDWRTQAKQLIRRDVAVIDPMTRDYRGKEDENVNAIVEGDKADIESCQAIIAMCPSPSWGTAMELGWSHANSVGSLGDKQRICVAIVPEGQPISPWLRYHTERIVHTLADAVKALAIYDDTQDEPSRVEQWMRSGM